MPEKGIRVVARLQAHPQRVAALQEVLTGLLQPTRAEDGCIRYELLHNTAEPTDFTFVEEWTGEDALQAHFRSPHLLDARERFADLLATPADIRIYRVLG